MRRGLSLLSAGLGALALMAFGTASASAHGERAQEGFSRMETVAWWDVKFSQDSVAQNQTVTITGTAKLLETWPINLSSGEPDVCYLTVVEPGARFVLRDRVINGAETPQSFICHKGGAYNFTMTLAGRDPGYWHVHPALAVRQTGTLIGPGKWITVTAAAGGFSNPVQLLSGKTVDIEGLGTPLILVFSLLTFLLGMAWMLWWTVPRPTITRLAVTNQLPLNQDGGEAVGLITRRDHQVCAIMAGIAAVLVVGGFAYQALAYTDKIPLQSDWLTPPSLPQAAQIATAEATGSTYDSDTHTLTINTKVTNVSQSPVTLTAFRTAYLAFVNPAARAPESGEYTMTTKPEATIAAGQTMDVTLTVQGTVLEQERLLPIGKAQSQIAGVLEFQNPAGDRNMNTIETAFVLTSL